MNANLLKDNHIKIVIVVVSILYINMPPEQG